MQHRPSAKDREKELDALIRLRDELEFDNHPDRARHAHPASKNIIAAWKEYECLPKAAQAAQRNAWDKYYKDVQNTPIYQIFLEQRRLMNIVTRTYEITDRETRSEAQTKTIQLSADVRKMWENGDHLTLRKPSFPDPWEFNSVWIQAYKDVLGRIDVFREAMRHPLSDEGREVWSE